MKLLYIFVLAALSLVAEAQNPKWYKKARKAQTSVLVEDKTGTLRQGQGFFIDKDGTTVVDYDLLKGATKITLATTDNKTATAQRLAGANALYNVAKFTTDMAKTQPLAVSEQAVLKGDLIYLLPTPTEKEGKVRQATVENVEKFDEVYAYYKVSGTADERLVGCPALNEAGELVGLCQVSGKDKNRALYVVSINYCLGLEAKALDANNADLKDIGLPVRLPSDENQAASFLFLAGQTSPYFDTYIDDFIQRFPQNPLGYQQKAEAQVSRGAYEEAEATFAYALKANTGKDDELHYAFSKALYAANVGESKTKPEAWTLERALEEAKAANAIKPAPLYTAMEGFCHYALKNYAEAFTCFDTLRTTNLRSAEYFTYAAQCKERMGADKEDVLALQDSAVATFEKPYTPEAATYLMLRATTLRSLKRYREAVADYNEYEHLMMRQLTANFYYEREQLELQCRMFEQALADIQHATTLDPKEPLYRAEHGAVAYRCALYDESIAACQEAVRLDDTFPDAYRIWAMSLIQQGKKAEAKEKLQRAIDLGDEVAKKLLGTEF